MGSTDGKGIAVEKLTHVVLKASEHGLVTAADFLLSGDGAIDTEDWTADSQLSAAESDGFLSWLMDPKERQELFPDIPADRATHTAINAIIHQEYPHSLVVGQKATDAEWSVAETAPDGSLIFAVDAIDGSIPYKALTFGYSTNILVFRREGASDRALMAAVSSPNGLCLLWESTSPSPAGACHVGLWHDHPLGHSDWGVLLADPLTTATKGTVAVLAADRRHRDQAAALLDDESLTVFTTGGAPASFGMALGNLESLVATRRQTLWDAAYLPALISLGIPVISLEDGSSLSSTGVAHMFSQMAREPANRQARPVPPFVASRTHSRASQLARMLSPNLSHL